jgi:type IV secretion system protein VirD4
MLPARLLRNKTKNDKKINALFAVVILLLGLMASTQFFAQQFGYQAVLGAHWGYLYVPWDILVWATHWYAVYPNAFMEAGSMGILVCSAGLMALMVFRQFADNTSRPAPSLHGSARWADRKDIERAGLLSGKKGWRNLLKKKPPSTGVYVGAWADTSGNIRYLRHNGPEHILTFAPTRSGKGVGLVLPTLLSWTESAVITDLKGELWALTAGWRQQYAKNKVLRFEPASATGCVKWNPLDAIRVKTEHEVGDVQNLATLIVDPDGKGLQDHWQKTAQSLLTGLILHALYKGIADNKTASLAAVDALLVDPKQGTNHDGLWKEMASYQHRDNKNHPVVGATAQDMMARDHRESGSIISTTKSYLSLYRDPVVAENTRCSDFCIQALMNDDRPVSLYIVTKPVDKDRLRPLIRVLLNSIVRILANKIAFEQGHPKANYRHRLLAMLDEFPSLGKLEILQESLAYVAGYGIKFYLICQDINQLKSREKGYGPDETITSNCHIQNAYPPVRIETAEHISKLTGQTTITKEQITTSGRRTSALLGQVSRTLHEVQRPLLTPDEALRMKAPKKDSDGNIVEAGDMVVYAAGCPAIYGRQPLYFQDPVFTARAKVPAPEKSDLKTRRQEQVCCEQD